MKYQNKFARVIAHSNSGPVPPSCPGDKLSQFQLPETKEDTIRKGVRDEWF